MDLVKELQISIKKYKMIANGEVSAPPNYLAYFDYRIRSIYLMIQWENKFKTKSLVPL